MTSGLEVLTTPLRRGFGFVPDKLEPLCFEKLFGNRNPVEIEFGSGKGKFLLTRAEKEADRNFIGVDWARKWLGLAFSRGEKRDLKNLKFLNVRAQDFLTQVPPLSVEIFHVYFPDPWPKRRHAGRRLVNADFLDQLGERLKPRGLIELATDFEDYFSAMKKAAADTRTVWRRMRETVNQRISYPHIKTNYELKYETAGRTLHYLELEKP